MQEAGEWDGCALRLARVALAGALLAGCASDPAVEDARRIVDRAQPLRCELLALEEALASAPGGSATAAGLAARVAQARGALKAHYIANLDEYIAVMKRLTFEQRKTIYRYSDAAAGRCPAGGREAPR